MTTDNRTNETTPEQVEAADAAFAEAFQIPQDGTTVYEVRKMAMRAALKAAQGAASQAEAYDHCCQHPRCPGGSLCCCASEQRLRDCWNQWREEIAGDSKQAFRDGYQAGRNDPAPWPTAPVLPSVADEIQEGK